MGGKFGEGGSRVKDEFESCGEEDNGGDGRDDVESVAVFLHPCWPTLHCA